MVCTLIGATPELVQLNRVQLGNKKHWERKSQDSNQDTGATSDGSHGGAMVHLLPHTQAPPMTTYFTK